MRYVILVVLVLLVGCTIEPAQINDAIDKEIEASLSLKAPEVKNYKTPYYSFYLPPHVGVRDSNKIGTTFISQNHEILMNIDIPTIIMRRYYRYDLENNMRVFDLEKDDYQYQGKFENFEGDELDFEVFINEDDQKYIILVHSNHVVLSSWVPLSNVPAILSDMLLLMRFTTVDEPKIVQTYSRKQIIDYQQQVLEMFEQVAPESGTLLDMDRLINGMIEFPDFEDFVIDDDYINSQDESEPGE
ncbi:MAG: hypothetical protein GX845_04565 [Erysipelothrix sp.]|jgi:hypothetical protein|nr:hypothetical protein [Erysipelothrix sp.]